jgi:hypothetical protein
LPLVFSVLVVISRKAPWDAPGTSACCSPESSCTFAHDFLAVAGDGHGLVPGNALAGVTAFIVDAGQAQ